MRWQNPPTSPSKVSEPGVAERLGIDASRLRTLNDRLIHCSISGFGRAGPLKNSPGYDVILQRFAGSCR